MVQKIIYLNCISFAYERNNRKRYLSIFVRSHVNIIQFMLFFSAKSVISGISALIQNLHSNSANFFPWCKNKKKIKRKNVIEVTDVTAAA